MTIRLATSGAASASDATCDLTRRIELAAEGPFGVTVLQNGASTVMSWAALHDLARVMATNLQALGVGPADKVGILATTSHNTIAAVQGIWLAGAVVVVLPVAPRSPPEKLAETLRSQLALTESRVLLADDMTASLVPPLGDHLRVLDLVALGKPVGDRSPEPAGSAPSDLAVLQLTSGSTADPKAVMITKQNITVNLDAISVATERDAEAEVMVSWVPLFHDLGLMGYTAMPMTTGSRLVVMDPTAFLADPSCWMRAMSDFAGTSTSAPNFAFGLASRYLGGSGHLNLSSCQWTMSGGEMVRPELLRRFARTAACFGFDEAALSAGYGMAETTLATTLTKQGHGVASDTVDAKALETTGEILPPRSASRGRELARVGSPVPGVDLRIRHISSERELPELQVGEIEVRGPSVSPGYYRDQAATNSSRNDDWFRTGDLGYLVDGDLVVCGRSKDMIIVGGRNIYPEEVECVAESVKGVRAGNVIAVGVDSDRGREDLVVLAETRAAELRELGREVRLAIRGQLGVRPAEVVLLAPGSLPKTSSGKLKRSEARRLFMAGELHRHG